MADAGAAMRELARVAHQVAICMWGVEEVQMFAAIGRTARALGSGSAEQGARRYRTARELHDLLIAAGLTNVETRELDVTAAYVDFEDFWRALSRQVGPQANGCTASTITGARFRTTSCTSNSAAPAARSSCTAGRTALGLRAWQ
jgi:hypothetical protein